MRSNAIKALVFACAVTWLSGWAPGARSAAQAQAEETRGDEVKGNIAGTIGLGLLGAEVGLLLVPAVNLQDHWWAWALFPTITAAGGAVAGALVFEAGDPDPAVTVSLLAAGMALAIPAIVGALAIKNKRQSRDDTASEGGMLRFGSRQRWGVPAVSTEPVYSTAERLRYGVEQRTMVRVPLVSGRF